MEPLCSSYDDVSLHFWAAVHSPGTSSSEADFSLHRLFEGCLLVVRASTATREASGPGVRSRMAKPNEELERGRNLQNQGRLRLSSERVRPVLMGYLLLQHSSAAGRQTPAGSVVVLLVVLLPAVLTPSQSCTTPYAPTGPSSSDVPAAPAPTDIDGELVLSERGTASPSSPRGTCPIVRPETATLPTPAQPGRQDVVPLDSDPTVSSGLASLEGALKAEISSFGPSASTRSLPHLSQGSPGHLRSVVLRV